ncbi:MAG TPA: MHYT domain-containing protein [Micromonosporaceae bacterium]
MAEIHHFEYGPITAILSYGLSVLGSSLGLTCAVRMREAKTSSGRVWWLILAAWAIGGTAIWTMHFMAMLGFGVVSREIRYDIPITVASAVIAIVVVGIGLFIVGRGRPSAPKIMAGGLLTGLGVAAMHYTGMAAMRMDARVDYDLRRVGVSIAIAVVAATVALWLAVVVHSAKAIIGSALVMGVAVNGMHFTGMSAMSVHLRPSVGAIAGATAFSLLVPIVLAVIVVVIGLIYAVLAAPTEEDRAGVAYMNSRIADRLGAPPEPPPVPAGRAARRTYAGRTRYPR